MVPNQTSRRRMLTTIGAATVVGLAGCGGGGNGGGLSGEEYPAADDWLTETSVGTAAPNYDGTVQDSRGSGTVEVAVGSGDTGTAFEPAAVAISTGSTVRWAWTGDGGQHNVEAEPDDQIGESDYEFSSGEPVQSSSKTFEQTLDSAGVALYHCEPHLSVGMKGAVVVLSA